MIVVFSVQNMKSGSAESERSNIERDVEDRKRLNEEYRKEIKKIEEEQTESRDHCSALKTKVVRCL